MSRCCWMVPISCLLLGIPSAHAAELDLSQGMKELGGTVTLDVYSLAGETLLGLDLSPAVGYFVADNVEVILALHVGFIGDVMSFAGSAGLNYYLQTDAFPLYLGGDLGYGRFSEFGFAAETGLLRLAVGAVPALADNIALDVGLRLNIFLGEGGGLHVPIGYMGVRAYFR